MQFALLPPSLVELEQIQFPQKNLFCFYSFSVFRRCCLKPNPINIVRACLFLIDTANLAHMICSVQCVERWRDLRTLKKKIKCAIVFCQLKINFFFRRKALLWQLKTVTYEVWGTLGAAIVEEFSVLNAFYCCTAYSTSIIRRTFPSVLQRKSQESYAKFYSCLSMRLVAEVSAQVLRCRYLFLSKT